MSKRFHKKKYKKNTAICIITKPVNLLTVIILCLDKRTEYSRKMLSVIYTMRIAREHRPDTLE